MAKQNTSYNISLRLTAKQFEKGLKKAQNSLKRFFRSSALKFGAMMGFGSLGQEAIEVAKNLNKADSILKNVSSSSETLAQNQQFLSRIAKQYNQDLIVLTQNFAKYHATANQAGVSLQEQQYIYESLTRAAAHFGLTSEETGRAMTAITQSFSKGTIQAEELKTQLAEVLPGAAGYMAKGMGISIKQLNKMMEQGKLLATEGFGAMAKAMNESFGSFDTDSITANTNKLKNAFSKVVKSSGVDKMWNSVVRGSAKAVEAIADNFKGLKTAILSIVAGITGGKIWGGLSKSFVEQVEIINAEAAKKLKPLKQELGRLTRATDDAYKTYQSRLTLSQLSDAELTALGGKPDLGDFIRKQLPKDKQAYETHKAELDKIKGKIAEIETSTKRATSAFGYMGGKLKMIGTMLKGAFISMIPAAIISSITFLVSKLVEAQKAVTKFRKELKNIIKVSEEGKKNAAEAESPDDAVLDALGQQYDEIQKELDALPEGSDAWNAKMKESEQLLKSLNKYLGLEGKAVLKLGDDWKKAIKEKKQYYAEKRVYDEAVRQNVAAKSKRDEYREKARVLEVSTIPSLTVEADMAKAEAAMDAAIRLNKAKDDLKKLQKAIEDETKVINKNSKIIADFEIKYPQTDSGADLSGTDTGEQSGYGKIKEDYFKELDILERKLEDGVISQEEFNSATRELARKTLDSLYALDGFKVGSDEFSLAIMKAAEALEIDPVQKQIQQAIDQYNSRLKELNNQRDAELITENEYNDSLRDLTEETIMALAAMGAFADGIDGFEQNLLNAFNADKEKSSDKAWEEYQKNHTGKNYDRDTTFDYRKGGSDIAEENLDNAQRQIEDIESALQYLNENMDILFKKHKNETVKELERLNEELAKAKDGADSLEDALTFARIKEDVEQFQKELNDATVDSIETVAGSFRNLAESIRNMSEVMSDTSATGFEKFISILDIIGQMINGLAQGVQVFQRLSQATKAYQATQLALQGVQDASMAKTLAQAGTEVVASEATAMAKGTSSAAGIPFPYNLVAIGAVLASIAGIFASLPKFKSGGIVGGTSTSGDNTLIRANAGEMILNKGQQSTLFNLLNGKGSIGGTGGGEVHFKLRGQDLYGSIQNYRSKSGR